MTIVWNYWTEEEVENLRQLWAKGHTGAEIASMLGKSRNAVMGRISRMRERGERLPSERERKPPKPKVAKVPRVRKASIVLPPTKRVVVEYVNVDYDPNKKYPKFQELKKWQCLYVMNDGHASKFVFCGEKTNFESFCPSHKRLCYTKVVKNDASAKPAGTTNYAKRKFFGAFSH
jgi:GcrA cell cycle regulator